MLGNRRGITHMCFAARALGTIEHLGAIAAQAEHEGFEVCWLDLGDQEGISDHVERYTRSSAAVVEVRSAKALRRHFRRHRPVAVWMQTPYPEHYPAWFWDTAEGLLAYAGYGLTLSTWSAGLYGLETYARCAWILTESPRDRDHYIEHGVSPQRVVHSGNPLLFELRAALAESPDPQFDVMWAPHWTEDWFGKRGYSRWRETVGVLLEYAVSHPDSRILVRPHPLLHAGIAALTEGDPAADAYRELVALPNTTVSVGPMLDDLVRCAALLTDGVSIIAYWSATGKPLGITRDAESPPFNDTGEQLCAASDILSTAGAVANWLDSLGTGQNSARRRALSELLHPTFDKSPVAVWNALRLS